MATEHPGTDGDRAGAARARGPGHAPSGAVKPASAAGATAEHATGTVGRVLRPFYSARC